jgi:hypothetical protein
MSDYGANKTPNDPVKEHIAQDKYGEPSVVVVGGWWW